MSASKNPSIASALLGSAFLMATSAIGPGFITQTTVFTEQLVTSFGFIILCSILLDIVVQLNIWRVVTITGQRAQDLANRFFFGAGHLLTFLIVLGGLAFNIGNIAGAALGINVLTGADLWVGALVSVAIALIVFWYKEAGAAMDLFSKVLGMVMIALTAYVAISSNPPLAVTLKHTFVPERIDTTAIIVLVGGTVGGYISFAGAHRLLDAGVTGIENVKKVSGAAVRGIVIASLMRVLLFLAALGVVVAGVTLDPGNPAATVFQSAAGNIGYKVFGVVLWCAAITSVVGSAYTSVSFLRSVHAKLESKENLLITVFITISACVFLWIGRPVSILVIVGALNAFILPIALAIILLVSVDQKFMGTYKHPRWLIAFGWLVVIVLLAMSVKTILIDLSKFW
jgi:Mn2+/Fe2+ NRAMP family transporter